MRFRKHVAGLSLALFSFLLASPAFAADTDSDGLDNAFELAIGTDPGDADSDDDGLSDFDEVYVVGSDPNLADTDGDGTNDDTDTSPLQYGGAIAGTTTANGLPVNTAVPYAWSGHSATEGHGVYVHSGMFEYVTSAGHVIDLTGPWSFLLHYSSHDLRNGYSGVGWTSMLDEQVVEVGADVQMLFGNGVQRQWTWDSGGGVFVAPDGVLGELTKVSTEYTWLRPDGSKCKFDMAEDGRLVAVLDRYGNGLTIGHDVNHRPDTITDSRGEVHALAWYGTDRLKTITYADGRVWTFEYDDDDNLVRILGPATTGFPSGITEEFRYIHGSGVSALNHNMIQRIDGNGYASLKMQYDTSDRVTVQTIGSDDTEFDYTNSASYETTVFDGAGNERVWTWDPGTLCKTQLEQMSNRNVRAGDPTSWDTQWGYDADGYLTSVTLPRGNGVKYTLNAVKRVTERRHKQDMSVGDNNTNDIVHTFTYETSAKFYAVATHTDPEGSTTTYTNNSDGRPTTITYETVTHVSPNQTITNSYTYNGDGTIATFTDGESKVTDYDYYTTGPRKGRVQTMTVDDGGLDLETGYDYNDFGETVTITDPNGNTTTHTVNAYGRAT